METEYLKFRMGGSHRITLEKNENIEYEADFFLSTQ